MARWVYGTQGIRQSDPVFDPQLGITEDKIVTFIDFVKLWPSDGYGTNAISHSQNSGGISLRQEGFQRNHPFATQGARIGLFGPPDRPDRQVVFVCLEKKGEEVQSIPGNGEKTWESTDRRSRDDVFPF